MCFENRDRNQNRRVELVCECREVRSERDNRDRCERERAEKSKCRCHERRRRCCFFGW